MEYIYIYIHETYGIENEDGSNEEEIWGSCSRTGNTFHGNLNAESHEPLDFRTDIFQLTHAAIVVGTG